MQVLAVITARGGSVRLPRKNVLPFRGEPLIAWTVKASNMARLVTRTILSSDDREIADEAAKAGCDVPFMRPAELATASASSLDVVLHAIDAVTDADFRPEIVVLLQPTSPLRTASDIDACIEACLAGAPACVSVASVDKPWSYLRTVDEAGTLAIPAPPRGPAPGHVLNGAVYAIWTDILRSQKTFAPTGTKAHVMPSLRSVDIDTWEEFKIAEAIASLDA